MTRLPTPSQAELDAFAEPPKWPKTVGIISIVWGGLGVACGVCGSIAALMAPTMMKAGEPQFGPAPAELMPSPLTAVNAGVGTLVAILLIVAGILLVSRKPVARTLHLVYAGLSLLTTLIATIIGVMAIMDQMSWVRANPDNPWAKQANPVIGIVATAFGVALGAAWPVFCLVWFGLKKTRASDITGETGHELSGDARSGM